MVQLLVSVRDVHEAEQAITAGVDIIDIKDPDNGALGRMDPGMLRAIVSVIDGRCQVSATTGDLLPGRDDIGAVAEDVAATKVNFVKIGLWPGGRRRTIRNLGERLGRRTRLIGVLLADANPDLTLLPLMVEAGFAGAMLDVAGKGVSLMNQVAAERLAAFVSLCRENGLLSGLAGSLRIAHIPDLVNLNPNVIGFRGGLCVNGDRRCTLDPAAMLEAVAALRQAQAGRALALNEE